MQVMFSNRKEREELLEGLEDSNREFTLPANLPQVSLPNLSEFYVDPSAFVHCLLSSSIYAQRNHLTHVFANDSTYFYYGVRTTESSKLNSPRT